MNQMEENGDDRKGLCSSKASEHPPNNAVTVLIHPLVVMNISEHATRHRAQNSESGGTKIYGVLLGTQLGRNVEMKNSFEVKLTSGLEEYPAIDKNFYSARLSQYQEVFPDTESIGWYTVDNEQPTEVDYQVHLKFLELMESPIMIKLDPSAACGIKLPLNAYESLLAPDSSLIKWRPIEWELASEQAERIGIEHIAQISTLPTSTKVITNQQIAGQLGAINMLYSKLKLISDYLHAVRDGTILRDEQIIREIIQLMNSLPIIASERFSDEFKNMNVEAQMILLVGAITKTCGTLSELVTRMNVIISEKQTAMPVWNIGRRCRPFNAV